ncbi:MAG: Multidrug export protein MepA [Alphaproteobacteria bacterium MarineAlpha5_Bin8]|nr:MAG: Multidrug export protein MepA [Alphaproteobacteria bacterium MarineAlpha5_Bin7]PPR46968.1 MAG: Multidrug export protein MepA [Alphaproteobacteria bacterium MarineAlpha5_Bin8]|tara:strand:- start:1364 stop:2752 length:1389 start_codon:yes stop_codon:yes gene_type:complete
MNFLKKYFSSKPSKLSLTEDPIVQLFIRIAIPSSVGTIFQTLYNIVDTYFAGKISAEALSAIAQTFPVFFIIIAMGVGISIGITALIANALGEKKDKEASYLLAQGVILSIAVAIIITIIGILIAPHIISTISKSTTSLDLSIDYLNIIFLGSVFIFIQMSVNSSLNAIGDTKSYRNVLIFSFFLNIVLNPLLIFGYGIIPALGIKGIALSTIISQFVGLIYILYKVSQTYLINYLYPKCFIPKINIIIDLLKQGLPASFGMMMISVGVYVILYFISQFGDMALAGYGTAIRYEQIFLLPVLGLNTAVLSMVGQNFGAKKINRINEIYNKALIYGCGLMFICAFLIYFTAEYAVGLFTDNAEVLKYGTTYLRITCFMEPIYPIFFISNALIQGIKRPNIVLLFTILRMVVLPSIVLSILIFKMNFSFEYVFWGLLIINWIFGIFVFLITKKIIKNQIIKYSN